jgi:hypothetical protein
MIRLVELGLTMHDELSEEPPRTNVYRMIAFAQNKLFHDMFHSRFA